MRLLVRRNAGIFCLALMLTLVSAVGVGAQATTAPATAGTAVPVVPGTFSGKVTKTDPLTVNSNGQDRVVTNPSAATVTRNGDAAKLSDIKTGDDVNVTTGPNNATTSIVVTGDKGGLPAWLIPLLLLLLLGLILFFLLGRRKKTDDFVIERNNTPTNPPTTRR